MIRLIWRDRDDLEGESERVKPCSFWFGRGTEGSSVKPVSFPCEKREYQRQDWAMREQRGVEGISKEIQ